MSSFDLDLINIIDARFASQSHNIVDRGTVTTGTDTAAASLNRIAYVTFDGSKVSVPVIAPLTVGPVFENDRVALMKTAHNGRGEWVIIAVLNSQNTLSAETLLWDDTLVASSSNYQISDIPQAYRDLRLVLDLRDTQAALATEWCFYFNNNTSGSRYFAVKINNAGYNSTASNNNTAYGAVAVGSTAGSSVSRGANIVDLPFYSRGSGFKHGTFRFQWCPNTVNFGYNTGGFSWSGPAGNGSGGITQINIIPNGGTSLAAGSAIRIYGIGRY